MPDREPLSMAVERLIEARVKLDGVTPLQAASWWHHVIMSVRELAVDKRSDDEIATEMLARLQAKFILNRLHD